MNGYIGRRFRATELKNMYDITPKLIQKTIENLNFFEKLNLRIRGSLFIDNIKFEGWSEEVPLYLFKCNTHGYELNYPSGHGMKLFCIDCIRERLKKTSDISERA